MTALDTLARALAVREPDVDFPKYPEEATYADFQRTNLPNLINQRWYFGKGRKRLRKKRVKRFLATRWVAWVCGCFIRAKLAEASFARSILPVREIPEGTHADCR